MFTSSGNLIYSTNPYKLILKLDNDLGNYYRVLIPKHIKFNRPRYEQHISIIRNEIPIKLEFWNKYQDKEIVFKYDPYIYMDETYIWLNVVCKDLEDIRLELGLSNDSEFTKPPDGSKFFHSTIANFKGL